MNPCNAFDSKCRRPIALCTKMSKSRRSIDTISAWRMMSIEEFGRTCQQLSWILNLKKGCSYPRTSADTTTVRVTKLLATKRRVTRLSITKLRVTKLARRIQSLLRKKYFKENCHCRDCYNLVVNPAYDLLPSITSTIASLTTRSCAPSMRVNPVPIISKKMEDDSFSYHLPEFNYGYTKLQFHNIMFMYLG